MPSLIQAIILSIVQGITEWIPVSSSGHLILFQKFLGIQDSQTPYYVFLHLASVFAVIVFFWKDILNIFKNKNLNYLLLIVIAIIPAGIIGLVFMKEIENLFSSSFYLGLFFIFSGVIVYLTKFSIPRKEKISFFDSLLIGIFQVLAVFPSVSRSGMTISSGLFVGLTKKQSIKFSFLMLIPIILGASLVKADELVLSEISYFLLILSFIITFLVSLVTIKLLIKVIESDNFYLFGVYNIVLGIVVLIWSLIN